jgi:ketosteroid isomerase-like protein
MIDRIWAERFAMDWASQWNVRDLDSLLAHYAPNVVFYSPRISVVLGTQQSFVFGTSALQDYWKRALELTKHIHFEIEGVGVGSDAVTITYRNQRGEHVAETLLFDGDLKVIQGIVTYLAPMTSKIGEG